MNCGVALNWIHAVFNTLHAVKAKGIEQIGVELQYIAFFGVFG